MKSRAQESINCPRRGANPRGGATSALFVVGLYDGGRAPIMRLLRVTAFVIACGACAHRPTPEPAMPPAPAVQQPSPVAENFRRMKEAWATCLHSSFSISRTQVADKNAAAESAFQACTTEEQVLLSYAQMMEVSQPLVFALKARLKSEMVAAP
jgi:hypothetical protein